MSDTQNPNCLDAETLAAWVDGGLSGGALTKARTHVADCERCQMLVAVMVRTEVAVLAPAAERPARRWLGWLVPLAAAATAVAIWVAVPPRPVADLLSPVKEEAGAAAQPTPNQSVTEPKAPAAPPAAPAAAPAVASAEARRQTVLKDEAKNVAKLDAKKRFEEVRQNKELDRVGARDASAAAPPPPPTVAAERAAAGLGAAQAFAQIIEIVSPDPLVRWRIRGPALERSVDAGKTWEAVTTGVTAALTAGAAPSTSVCWLVGRAGAVLLTTDGRTWRRLTFPEATDLSAVRATDARTATVTTADGREYSTTDAGGTWIRRQ